MKSISPPETTNDYYCKHLFICTNQKEQGKKCCANSGGKPYFEIIKKKLNELGMHGPGKIRVSQTGCLGRCELGPCIVIYPEGVWYTYQSEADIDEIILQALLEGKTVEKLLLDNTPA